MDIEALRRAIGKAMLGGYGDGPGVRAGEMTRLAIAEILMTTMLHREDSDTQTQDDTNAPSDAQAVLAILNAIANGERIAGRTLQTDLSRYLTLAQRIATLMA